MKIKVVRGLRYLTFTEVPDSVKGAEQIVTACNSKKSTKDVASFIAAKAKRNLRKRQPHLRNKGTCSRNLSSSNPRQKRAKDIPHQQGISEGILEAGKPI